MSDADQIDDEDDETDFEHFREDDLCIGCGAADDEPHDDECPFDEFEGF